MNLMVGNIRFECDEMDWMSYVLCYSVRLVLIVVNASLGLDGKD